MLQPANAFIAAGENDRAEQMPAASASRFSSRRNILMTTLSSAGVSNALFPIEMVKDYYALGKPEKAKALATELTNELTESIRFYLDFYPMCKSDFEYSCNLIYYMTNDVIRKAGDKPTSPTRSKRPSPPSFPTSHKMFRESR